MGDKKLNICILRIKGGQGHISPTNAIYEEFIRRKLDKEFNIHLLFGEDEGLIEEKLALSYNYLVRNHIKLAAFLTKHYKIRWILRRVLGQKADFEKKELPLNVKKFNEKYKPDIVISSYPWLSYVITAHKHMLNNLQLSINLVCDPLTVNTDWDNDEIDLYYVPTSEAVHYLRNKGIDIDKIIEVPGLATSQIMITELDIKQRKNLLEPLGLNEFCDESKPTLFINSGANGSEVYLKILETTIKTIKKYNLNNLRIIFLSGKNEKMKTRALKISKSLPDQIKIVGFVDTTQMSAILQSSHAQISKPGANTIFESIYTETPLIIYGPLMHQEEECVYFAVENTFSEFIAENDKFIPQLIKELALEENQGRFGFFRNNIKKYKQKLKSKFNSKNAAEVIIDDVIKQINSLF